MIVGFFIGRFQPLHRGHLLMIKECTKKVDRLVIGLGSSNVEPSCKNPFTALERREMIVRGMEELGIRNSDASGRSPDPSGCRGYEIVEVPDFESDEEWVKGVQKVVGKFDRAWSGSEWVLRVFKEHGLPIERIKEFPGLSGTRIRRRMAKELPWLKFVPLSVRKYLREIKAAQRVRQLCAYETTK